MATTPPVSKQHALTVEFEPRMCNQHVVDLTFGCSFGCLYCPFSDLNARRHEVARPTAADISVAATGVAPQAVYLSAASDAFTPQAAANTHALLAAWLPQGTKIGIVTKGIIPPRTVDLLAEFRAQIEGVAVGVTSLDDHRNRILEPGCPPADERLASIDRLAARGLTVALRIDPLFPDLDDAPPVLATLVGEAASRGAIGVVATYVFAWGRYLRRLQREPLLANSCRLLTERTPMEGGVAWSVPLARKLQTYTYVAEVARARRLLFGTCGCKDVRMKSQPAFWSRCRLPAFVQVSDSATPSLPPG
ncbi:MAG: radical SAM protein [Candidatus Binatia bacterium]